MQDLEVILRAGAAAFNRAVELAVAEPIAQQYGVRPQDIIAVAMGQKMRPSDSLNKAGMAWGDHMSSFERSLEAPGKPRDQFWALVQKDIEDTFV